MSIFNNLESFGTVETTRSYSYSKHLDPKIRLRRNFIQNAKIQIDALQGTKPLSPNAWVSSRRTADGGVEYRVSLRVGPRLIPFPNGGTHLVVKTKEKAVEFLETMMLACDEGHLDERLQSAANKKEPIQ